jgi:hypothetical protein
MDDETTHKRLAQKRATVQVLHRHLEETYISKESHSRANIICEDVFVADQVVPQEVLEEISVILNDWALGYYDEMRHFQMTRGNARPWTPDQLVKKTSTTTKVPDAAATPKPKTKKKARKPEGPGKPPGNS